MLKAQLFWWILRGDKKKKKKTYVNYNEKTQSISEGNSGIYSK